MKKFIAVLLTLMLTLCACSAAMAANEIHFSKSYVTNGNEGAVKPAATFSFDNMTFVSATDTGADYTEDWAKNNLPSINAVSFTTADAETSKNCTINFPTYPAVGIYNYTFKEVDGGIAGISYRDTTMKLVVTVQNDNTGKKYVAAVHCEAENADKVSILTNTYSAGSLAVTKEVTGNLGDKSKEFTATVTFTAPTNETVQSTISYTDGTAQTIAPAAWTKADGADSYTTTATITLKHGETVTFTNIPYGVTYTVVENSYTDAKDGGYDAASYAYTDGTDGKTIQTIDSALETATITNKKQNDSIDTGVTTDNLPYIVLMGIVVLMGAAMLIKRRAYND